MTTDTVALAILIVVLLLVVHGAIAARGPPLFA